MFHRPGTAAGDPTPRVPPRVPAFVPFVVAALLAFASIPGSAATVAAVDPTPTPSATTSPAPTTVPTSPAGSVTFYGRGYGHGLGMSQYGARGRALAGQLAPQILAHYYQGTTLATVDPATPIRILVVSGFLPSSSRPARVVAHGGPWTVDGVPGSWPAEGSATMTPAASPAGSWQLTIADATGAVLLVAPVASSVRIRPAGPATQLQVWFKPSYYDTYRGTIRLIGSGSGTITAIEETALDTYLLGVVTSEMPANWPVEALKAQAIAARSFAAAHLHPTTGSWDVYDDTRSQVYHGVLGESAAGTAVVAATAGQVLMAGSSVAMTLFHSSDGGATENNEDVYVSATGTVYGQPVSYLRGSPDRAPDGTSYDASSPYASWQTATYTYAQLSTVFDADPRSNIGDLSSIDLSNRGVSGRVISVTLVGSLGTLTVSGDVFRSIFNQYTPATDPYMWSTLIDTAPLPDVCPPDPAAANAIPGITATLAGCVVGAGVPSAGANTTPPPAGATPMPTPTPTPSPTATPSTTLTPVLTPVSPPSSSAVGSTPSTVLTLAASAAVITWASPVTLSIRFPANGANRTVALQGTRDGVAWTTIANLVTDGTGSASLTYRPPTNLFYRAVFGGAPDLSPALSATVRTVVRQIALLRPAGSPIVQAIARNTTVAFTTIVRPARPELAPATVTYRISQLVAGRWTLVATRNVVADANGLAPLAWTFTTPGRWSVSSAANPTPYNANSMPAMPKFFLVR